MNRIAEPGPRTGTVRIPASKSQAHRILICAALSSGETVIQCDGISRDIQATMMCLKALGVEISMEGEYLRVLPADRKTGGKRAVLPCGESGSTLRFLLPVVGALKTEAEFILEGRLPLRPLQPLWDVLEAHGMSLRKMGDRLFCSGKLAPGEYEIPGNISSQYVSGLLFALPHLSGESILRVTGKVESSDYIAMTEGAIRLFGIFFEKKGWTYHFPSETFSRMSSRHLIDTAAEEADSSCSAGRIPVLSEPFRSIKVESDWSSAAFFLAMGAFSSRGIVARGMNPSSPQGDRRILNLLREFGAEVSVNPDEIHVCRSAMKGIRIDASDIPDLVPVLAVVAAAAEGETIIEHAERLRLKESDRLYTTAAMLSALGGDIRETHDGLIIRGKGTLRGGKTSSFNDHRIAMAAAAAASLCSEPVEIEGAECTEKSFPGFWKLLESL